MDGRSRPIDAALEAALTRRQLFWLSLSTVAGTRYAAAARRNGPLVGAIRWDAWYAPGTEVTEAVERTLSPRRYRWRLPFFAKQEDTGRVRLPAITQRLMDLEIRQAVFAGLDYWAFVAYRPDSPMTVPLQRYLSSSHRHDLRFCMFCELTAWGAATRPAPLIDYHVTLMENDAYLRVGGNRPLYYLGFISEKIANDEWGGADGLRTAIERFRSLAIARGLGNPFIVLGVLPRDDVSFAVRLGGDALGAYNIADGHATGSYADLARIARNGWHTLATSGLPVIPTVMTGWDRRPRVEAPVPWENAQHRGAGIEYYFTAPNPQELAAHLQQALTWIKQQPADRQAPALLIYAWNENDEGGWLVPTVACDAERLQALHQMLNSANIDSMPGCAWAD